MSTELIGIVTVGAILFGGGVALAGVILTSVKRTETRLRQDMAQMEKRLDGRGSGLESQLSEFRERMAHEIGELRERMAKLEGLLEGLREAITGRTAAG